MVTKFTQPIWQVSTKTFPALVLISLYWNIHIRSWQYACKVLLGQFPYIASSVGQSLIDSLAYKWAMPTLTPHNDYNDFWIELRMLIIWAFGTLCVVFFNPQLHALFIGLMPQ